MNRTISRADLASLAHEERLRVVGVTTAEPFYEIEEFLVQHIEAGHMAGLDWFMPDRARQSCDPHVLHPKAKSIVSVAVIVISRTVLFWLV